MLKINFDFKDIDSIVADRDGSQAFIPKPFVFEDMISSGPTKVYSPGQTYTPFVDGLPVNTVHLQMCAHLCNKFFNYPTVKWGIRCIPSNATCPFGGRCHAAHLMWDGKCIGKSVDLNYQMINGLEKPQKTR